jgi:UDP:flavonoid glycosyltransferase YjiC (YdhE family)
MGAVPQVGCELNIREKREETLRKPPKRRRIMVVTFGSLGDLHPYLGIALGLRARGHDVIVASGECYRGKIQALGLGFAPVRPDSAWVADPELMRWFSHTRWGLIRVLKMHLRWLREAYEDTLAAVAGADLLVGNLAAFSLRLAAEKTRTPWVTAMHIPTAFFSAYDPPLIPGFTVASKSLRCLGPWFWGPFGRVLKWGTNGLAEPLHRFRRELGLPAVTEVNPLTDGYSPLLHLALFSKCLADRQPDWPAQTLVTGFPWYDQHGGSGIGLPLELLRFLDAGAPPIVFTLGTAVAADPGSFYEQSAAAARSLGRRAVLIAKDKRLQSLPDGVIVSDYARFSELFPRAAAVVHHGGIGTTGLAMRTGRPMLVMPCAWDQDDNAERAARLGIARTIPRRRYTAARVAAELQHLLGEPAYAQQAAIVGDQVRQEDGVKVVCDAVSGLLQKLP